ncbi:MAG: sodium/proline symporter [Chromatocurvus sp.]
MDKQTVVVLTLILYKLSLVGIGLWASRRTHSEDDFFLGGRGLGPWVAAVSYSSSASSAWTLLGMSGLAYVVGVSAIWVVLGSIVGMLVAWGWIAPRLMAYSRLHGQITLTDVLLHDTAGRWRTAIKWSASLIVIVSFVFYVAAQFQGAGNTFASTFDMPMRSSIVLGAAIIMVYTLLGGFWAVSVTDTVQGLLMAVTALLLPISALIEVGGWQGFLSGLEAVSTPEQLSLTADNAGLVAAGVVFGGLSIGIGTYGQPHLLVRFMALRDDSALRWGRRITILWFLIVFFGMFFLGLVGHILHAGTENPETIFFVLTDSLFPTLLGAVLLAAVLSAIMSTADSQLLVAASALSHDLGLGRRLPGGVMLVSRLTIVALVIAAVLVAVYLPEKIFSRVLFAWIALGSAFGPLLFARLMQIRVASASALASVVCGFALAVTLYLAPDTPGSIAERCLPFLLASVILWIGRRPLSP